MYSLRFSSCAGRQLKRLSKNDNRSYVEIDAKVRSIANMPRPANSVKIVAERGRRRVKVGKWRIVYSVDDRNRLVSIQRIDPRSKAYCKYRA
jgi:mRNA interferase RelE/StbE